ncbi:VOC family protein [Mucilaginibacter segetis]|uniref:VOC domain-containing protein n=1 Tax=Mucilaginibacter segetis TaxID=2793071 RepID=A0A934PS16_9SPHI|nr:VOC family protein [Mucilaginibacter segetis]MBK0378417.1 hypothetical protein [Mucilaginibacter segetis]
MQASTTLILSRIILFVHNVDKLTSFYTANFGLAVTEEIKGEWVVLNAGSLEIALHKAGNAYETGTENNTKLVFLTDALEQVRNNLLSNGAQMREVKSFEGINSLFCDGEDPEGNVFQLEQRLG